MTELTDVNAEALIRLTALQMAERLRAGEITSVELTRAHLDRIAAVDGAADGSGQDRSRGVHAFLHVNRGGGARRRRRGGRSACCRWLRGRDACTRWPECRSR